MTFYGERNVALEEDIAEALTKAYKDGELAGKKQAQQETADRILLEIKKFEKQELNGIPEPMRSGRRGRNNCIDDAISTIEKIRESL